MQKSEGRMQKFMRKSEVGMQKFKADVRRQDEKLGQKSEGVSDWES